MILEVLSSIRQEVNKYKFSCDDDVIQCYILVITCGLFWSGMLLFKSVKQNLLFSFYCLFLFRETLVADQSRYNSTLSDILHTALIRIIALEECGSLIILPLKS